MIEWRSLESNIWKLYVFKILFGFFISIPVIVLFWKDNGLSMFQVMVLQSLFSIAVILLEVPSGYFADLYGRRNSLTIASVFAALGIATYSIGQGFLTFLIGEVLWAIGVSLISGADSAMFYDTLVEMDKEESYKQMWGKASSFNMISAAGAAILGGFIAEYSLRWTLFAQVPFMAAMIPVAYSLKEPGHHRELAGKESKTMKAIMTEVWSNSRLRYIVLYGAFIYASLQVAFWMYQPYFELTGLQIAAFGWAYASFNVVSATSSRYGYLIEEKLGRKTSLAAMALLLALSLVLMSNILAVFSFTFIFIQQFVRGFQSPVVSDYINEIISSENRSTILSTKSLVGRILQAATLPVFGVLIDLYSVPQALTVLAATVLAGAAVLLLLLFYTGFLES
ncbi:MAG: MFS transporter [Candidatus Nanosalina sp.]